MEEINTSKTEKNTIDLYEILKKQIQNRETALRKTVETTDENFTAIPCVMNFAVSVIETVIDTLDEILETLADNACERSPEEDLLYNKAFEAIGAKKEAFYSIVNSEKRTGSLIATKQSIEKECISGFNSLIESYETTRTLLAKIDEAKVLYETSTKKYPEIDVFHTLNPKIAACEKFVKNFPLKTNYDKLKSETEYALNDLNDSMKLVAGEKSRLDWEEKERSRKTEEERRAREERERLERERIERERIERERLAKIAEKENKAQKAVSELAEKLGEVSLRENDYSLPQKYFRFAVIEGSLKYGLVESDFEMTATITLVDFLRLSAEDDKNVLLNLISKGVVSRDAKKVLVINACNDAKIDGRELKNKLLSFKLDDVIFTESAATKIKTVLENK